MPNRFAFANRASADRHMMRTGQPELQTLRTGAATEHVSLNLRVRAVATNQAWQVRIRDVQLGCAKRHLRGPRYPLHSRASWMESCERNYSPLALKVLRVP